jgi:hypothetical protein
VLVAALLLTAGSAWAGGHQDRSGGHSSGGGGGSHGGGSSNGGGGGHYAVPRSSSPPSSSGSGNQDHSSAGRSGVPIGSGSHHGPDRQPSNHHNGGHGGHGGHGGFHGGGYYPYGFGIGYWPGSFWGWYWDDWGWREPYGYPYGYGYGRGYGYGNYDQNSRDDMGALDLDLSPGDTEVYIDGERLGTVDDFDGWPQYLWLPKGTYDLTFYRDGYKTLARQVSVYPGVVVDMDDSLEQGASVRPQDLQTKTHERRDDRTLYERRRGEKIDRGEWDSRRSDDENWHHRAPHHRHDADRDRDRDDADRDDDRNDSDRNDAGDRAMEHGMEHGDMAVGSDSGWLHLDVDPEDSSVYLDGRFVGTGSELGSLQHGLKVGVGEHHLAVVRPGHKPDQRDFKVTKGQEVKLSVDLNDE